MQMIGSREASTRFGQLLSTVSKGTAITVTRNNQETAIMLSPEDFKLLGGEAQLLARKRKRMKDSWECIGQLMDEMADEAEKNGLTDEILKDIIGNE